MPTFPPFLALEAALTPPAMVPYYWHLPVLIIVVSLVYSATRYDEWGPILREAFRWGLRLTGFLFAIILVLFVVSTFID